MTISPVASDSHDREHQRHDLSIHRTRPYHGYQVIIHPPFPHYKALKDFVVVLSNMRENLTRGTLREWRVLVPLNARTALWDLLSFVRRTSTSDLSLIKPKPIKYSTWGHWRDYSPIVTTSPDSSVFCTSWNLRGVGRTILGGSPGIGPSSVAQANASTWAGCLRSFTLRVHTIPGATLSLNADERRLQGHEVDAPV